MPCLLRVAPAVYGALSRLPANMGMMCSLNLNKNSEVAIPIIWIRKLRLIQKNVVQIHILISNRTGMRIWI